MTDLPLIGGQISHVRDMFTEALWTVLVSATDAKAAVQKIVYSAKLREEALRLEPTYQARCGPMNPDMLRQKLGEQAKARGLGSVADEDLSRILRPYIAALMTYPEDVLTEAFTKWDAGCYFGGKKVLPGLAETMPTAHQLADLAAPALKEIQTVSWRLRRVREAVDRMTPPEVKRDRPTRADLIAQGILTPEGRAILPPRAPADIPEAF